MRHFKIILSLLWLLPFTLANAQEPLPWPPDPAGIFAPDVEIVESGAVVHPSDLGPAYDNDAHVVRVYEPGSGVWREFPYLDEITLVYRVDPYMGDLLVLTTDSIYTLDGEVIDPSGQWLLNTSTGEFSRPELRCGELRAPEGEGRWIARDFRDTPPELCHTRSGEHLALEIGMDTLDDDIATYVSPDGKRAIVFGHVGTYVYTFESGETLRLGGVQAWDIRSATWVGNDQVLIRETEMADMSFPWIYYSLGNVTQEDSLEQVTVVYKPRSITTLENPRRYEWVDYHDGDCYLVHLHAEDGHRDEYDLQDLCEQGIGLGDTDDRFLSPMSGEMVGEHTFHPMARDLVRFNPYTGERHDLFSGEVEFIMDISPDGRYAVIVLDDNGQIDMLTDDEMQYMIAEERPIHFRLAIISLETGDFLYEIPLELEDTRLRGDYWYIDFYEQEGRIGEAAWFFTNAYPNASLFSIGGDQFIFYHHEESRSTLIEVKNTGVTETEMDRVLLVLPGGEHLIMAANEDNIPGPLNAYDTTTGETTMIMPAVSRGNDFDRLEVQGYSLSLARGDTPDRLQVNIFNRETDESWLYIIRVP